MKRLARNKGCAKNFWKYCDTNSNGEMTKEEWGSCLGINKLKDCKFSIIQFSNLEMKTKNIPNYPNYQQYHYFSFVETFDDAELQRRQRKRATEEACQQQKWKTGM